jgi:hypothetical protein
LFLRNFFLLPSYTPSINAEPGTLGKRRPPSLEASGIRKTEEKSGSYQGIASAMPSVLRNLDAPLGAMGVENQLPRSLPEGSSLFR